MFTIASITANWALTILDNVVEAKINGRCEGGKKFI